jgi:hypothetical protein
MSEMMNHRRLLLAGMITLVLSNVASPSGCPTRPTVVEAVKNSKVIFAGKVVARLKYGVRFRIEKSWKGVSSRYLYIYTGNLRNDLDPWFEKGERWLVYAAEQRLYENEKATGPYVTKLMAPACNRTALLRDALEDLRQLGKPKLRIATSRLAESQILISDF